MSAKIGLLKHFQKLASFKGREDRASFWPYAALVLGIVMVASSLMMVPVMARSMRAMQDFTVQEPGDVNFAAIDPAARAQPNVADVMPSAGFLAAYLGVTLGLAVLLYAAAVVRRLHDRGKSGLWGLMPLPFILYSSIQMPRMFGSITQSQQLDVTTFMSVFVSNMLYMVTLIALVVLLAGPSDPEPNRYDLAD